MSAAVSFAYRQLPFNNLTCKLKGAVRIRYIRADDDKLSIITVDNKLLNFKESEFDYLLRPHIIPGPYRNKV